MNEHPGRYDDLATYCREQAKAIGVIVMVFDGEKGSGFSVQIPEGLMPVIPDVLDEIASQIRKDQEGTR